MHIPKVSLLLIQLFPHITLDAIHALDKWPGNETTVAVNKTFTRLLYGEKRVRKGCEINATSAFIRTVFTRSKNF